MVCLFQVVFFIDIRNGFVFEEDGNGKSNRSDFERNTNAMSVRPVRK
jgi:hypothetical protein